MVAMVHFVKLTKPQVSVHPAHLLCAECPDDVYDLPAGELLDLFLRHTVLTQNGLKEPVRIL
jgi:hypothetical protein